MNDKSKHYHRHTLESPLSLLARWAPIQHPGTAAQRVCFLSRRCSRGSDSRLGASATVSVVTQSSEGGVSAGLDEAASKQPVEIAEAFTFKATRHGSANKSPFASSCYDNRGDMQIETPCVVTMGMCAAAWYKDVKRHWSPLRHLACVRHQRDWRQRFSSATQRKCRRLLPTFKPYLSALDAVRTLPFAPCSAQKASFIRVI